MLSPQRKAHRDLGTVLLIVRFQARFRAGRIRRATQIRERMLQQGSFSAAELPPLDTANLSYYLSQTKYADPVTRGNDPGSWLSNSTITDLRRLDDKGPLSMPETGTAEVKLNIDAEVELSELEGGAIKPKSTYKDIAAIETDKKSNRTSWNEVSKRPGVPQRRPSTSTTPQPFQLGPSRSNSRSTHPNSPGTFI